MANAEFTVTRHAGRLVEARVTKLATREDVDAYARAFAPYIDGLALACLCADHRAVKIYSPVVADRLVALFTSLNRTWARAALLASPSNATLHIQLARVVRESKNPDRRVFTEASPARAFLSESLTREENDRLAVFLEEGTAAA